jgi:hypothetical protein
MPHLAGELFKSMAGVEHVPYRGNSAIMADLFAGRVAMMYDGPPTQLGNIQSGKVRGSLPLAALLVFLKNALMTLLVPAADVCYRRISDLYFFRNRTPAR